MKKNIRGVLRAALSSQNCRNFKELYKSQFDFFLQYTYSIQAKEKRVEGIKE